MRWTERRKRFRAHLAGSACIHPGSVSDPISARIAADLGFEIGMFAGSVASLAVLGGPDLILITLSEFAAQAYRISRAAELPLLVDADHGYGNALNVMRTVEELENAGVAGLTIEDTDLPRPFGPSGRPVLVPLDEGVGKMRAALAARRDPGLVIVGRTSAAAIAGIDETLARARAYAQAGVDALFFVGLEKREHLSAIAASVDLPIILGSTSAELNDREFLASQRVRIALQGHQPFAAGVQAVYDTLKALREGTRPADLKGVASAALMKALTRDEAHGDWTREFLGGA